MGIEIPMRHRCISLLVHRMVSISQWNGEREFSLVHALAVESLFAQG